jgi:integrase/recombinase XerD
LAHSKILPDVLTDTEVEAILSQFNTRYPGPRRNRLMIQLALETGLRVAEITALKFEHCRLMGNAYRVHVHEGKGAKDRIVWMSAALGAEIGEVAHNEGREYQGVMFTTRAGGAIDHGYLRRMIKARGKAAGVPRLHWHLLRHTSLTRLYKNTRDIRLVQDVAGHSDPKTTAIYAHVSGADIRDAMVGPEVEGTPDGPRHFSPWESDT